MTAFIREDLRISIKRAAVPSRASVSKKVAQPNGAVLSRATHHLALFSTMREVSFFTSSPNLQIALVGRNHF